MDVERGGGLAAVIAGVMGPKEGEFLLFMDENQHRDGVGKGRGWFVVQGQVCLVARSYRHRMKEREGIRGRRVFTGINHLGLACWLVCLSVPLPPV